jgi:hypothetical protein
VNVNSFIEGEDTVIGQITPVSKEEGETIKVTRLLFESGHLPAGHKLYRCISDSNSPATDFIGRRIGFTRLGDTHRMFVELKFYSAFFVSNRLFYMWEGFYMDCPELEHYTSFGVIIGATTRMVLTEKCLNKKSSRLGEL